MAKRVVIDCDVGTDDAIALMLFLHADKTGIIKIEAITTVAGNTSIDNVVKNVIRLLEAAGRTDIPVYKGSVNPLLLLNVKLDPYHGQDGFGDLKYDKEPDVSIVKPEAAPIAIGDLVMNNPGEIIICAMAPLTNLALAIKLYPKFAESVKEMFIMGGNDSGVGNMTCSAEFNFFADAEAAFIILESMKCPVTIVTWETTLKPQIPVDWRFNTLMEGRNDPVLNVINPAEKAVYDVHKLPMWNAPDALLAAAMLYPDKIVKKQEKYNATVELHGQFTRGEVILDHLKEKTPNVTIVHEIDEEAYKQLIMDASSGTAKKSGCACPSNPAANR